MVLDVAWFVMSVPNAVWYIMSGLDKYLQNMMHLTESGSDMMSPKAYDIMENIVRSILKF